MEYSIFVPIPEMQINTYELGHNTKFPKKKTYKLVSNCHKL